MAAHLDPAGQLAGFFPVGAIGKLFEQHQRLVFAEEAPCSASSFVACAVWLTARVKYLSLRLRVGAAAALARNSLAHFRWIVVDNCACPMIENRWRRTALRRCALGGTRSDLVSMVNLYFYQLFPCHSVLATRKRVMSNYGDNDCKHRKLERLQIWLSKELLASIDDYRFSKRARNRASAVRKLLTRGMEAGPVASPQKRR